MSSKRRKLKRPPGSKTITFKERQAMFAYWMEHDCNGNDVARQFSRNRKTIYRVQEEDGWVERMAKIKAEAAQKIDDKQVAAIVDHVEIARGILKKEALVYFNTNNPAAGTPQNVIAAMRYIDERLGDLPPANQQPKMGDNVVTIIQYPSGRTDALTIDDIERRRANADLALNRLRARVGTIG